MQAETVDFIDMKLLLFKYTSFRCFFSILNRRKQHLKYTSDCIGIRRLLISVKFDISNHPSLNTCANVSEPAVAESLAPKIFPRTLKILFLEKNIYEKRTSPLPSIA